MENQVSYDIRFMNLEQEILEIKKRNQMVEANKAWEVSWVRRLMIAAFTYVIAEAWLLNIGERNSWLKACVPVFCYILSTLSLSSIKEYWMKKYDKQ